MKKKRKIVRYNKKIKFTCKSFGVFNKYLDNLNVAALICGHDGCTKFLLRLKREEKQANKCMMNRQSIEYSRRKKKNKKNLRYIKT